MDEKREQVARQFEVVAHLCEVLGGVSSDMAELYRDPACTGVDELIEMHGERTARHMEILGDILNGMDAVDEEDEWTAPIFEAAHRLWPQKPPVP